LVSLQQHENGNLRQPRVESHFFCEGEAPGAPGLDIHNHNLYGIRFQDLESLARVAREHDVYIGREREARLLTQRDVVGGNQNANFLGLRRIQPAA
jgi:hypothetical protein